MMDHNGEIAKMDHNDKMAADALAAMQADARSGIDQNMLANVLAGLQSI